MGLNLGNAAGAGAMGLPLPGGTPAAGAGQPQMQNPLAQMLAGLGPNYQVPDTRWGMAGDRLLRFTPQQGNNPGGTFGKGGTPPPAGGGGGGGTGIQTGPNGSSVMPGLNPLGIGDGSGTQINWANLITAMQKPTTDPVGAPAINAAMEKLKQGPTAPGSAAEVARLREEWKAIANAPMAERKAPDWFARKTAAEQAYIQAQKNSGYGPGNTTGG